MIKDIKKTFVAELPFFLSVPALLWQVTFLYIPLLIIAYYSITHIDTSFSLTLTHYWSLLHFPHMRVILRSFFLASLTAVITLFLAYPIVYYLVLHMHRWRKQLLVILMLPFGTNFLVLAYSWFFLLERNGLINSFLLKLGVIVTPLSLVYNTGATLVVMVYCYLPFMIMPLYTSLEKLDTRLLEASADLGASPWQTFMRVTLPLSLSGIKTGLLLVFVPAFGEFAIPTLLGGSKFLVVGSLISYYFFVARNNALGAAYTILAGLMLLMIIMLLQHMPRLYALVAHRRSR